MKILIFSVLILGSIFSVAETVLCEGMTNDVNASENVKFELQIKKDDKNPIFKDLGSFYKSTIKFYYTSGRVFQGADISAEVSTRPNAIVFKGSVPGQRNLKLSFKADGSIDTAVMTYDSKISAQAVQCQVVGSLPDRPVCGQPPESSEQLLQAIRNSDINAVETAIECGANVNLADVNGCTPVMLALEPMCGQKKSLPFKSATGKIVGVVDTLTSNGAFVAVADKNGETPLMKAAKMGVTDVYETFTALEADFDAQDNLGYSALMFAVLNGDAWIIEQILEGNPNRSLKNKDGKTAFELATNLKKDTVADLVRIADLEVVVEGLENGSCTPLLINLTEGQVVDLTLVATDRMFKLDSAVLGIDLMADRNSKAKRTFAASAKGEFKFTCGFHGGNQPSEGVIVVK